MLTPMHTLILCKEPCNVKQYTVLVLLAVPQLIFTVALKRLYSRYPILLL